MSSRLFRAVVGLGISLGTASAACLGAVETVPAPEDASPNNTAPTDPGKPSTPGTTPTVPPDAQPDAAADAPADAPLDAFCDAAWPTTKGNPSGPTCGSVIECAEAGPAPHCYPETTPGTCESTTPLPAWCVSGGWKCSGNAVPADQCACWVGGPCP